MKIKKVMLFGYDFPHKKTQDFIFRLLTEGYTVSYIIAAPWKKLNISKPSIKISPVHVSIIHPRSLGRRFSIKYLKLDHNSTRCIHFLKSNPVDLCIISGARILSKQTIEAAENKILNLHPGLLPEVRGLDTLLWSIYYDVPLGISAHLISEKIDSGRLILKENLELRRDDSVIDVTLRLLEKQSDILIKAINLLKRKRVSQLKNLDLRKSTYNTKMSAALEKEIIKKFIKWRNKHANQQ